MYNNYKENIIISRIKKLFFEDSFFFNVGYVLCIMSLYENI